MPISADHLRAALRACAMPPTEVGQKQTLDPGVFNIFDDYLFKIPSAVDALVAKYNSLEGKPLPPKSEATSSPAPGLPQA